MRHSIPASSRRVFLAGIDPSTTYPELSNLITSVADVATIGWPSGRAFAFIDALDPSHASLLVEHLSGSAFHGHTLTARLADDSRAMHGRKPLPPPPPADDDDDAPPA